MAVSRSVVMKISSVVLLVGAALTLFLAQSAYWVNHTVFNQQTFSGIATTALQEESSRNAVASAVVDKALADRPVVKRLIGDRLTAFTSGLLASDISNQAMKTIVNKTYAYTTASNRDDIKIDLTTVNTALDTLIKLAQSQGGGDRLVTAQAQIPDEIVLVQSDSFPDLSGLVKTMLWLGPVLWLLSLGFAALYVYIGRGEYARRVYILGSAFLVVGLLGLFIMPYIPAALAAAMPAVELRPVAENMANGFLAPFRNQMYWLLGLVTVVLIVFNQRYNIVRGFQSLSTKISRMPKDSASNSKSAGKSKSNR